LIREAFPDYQEEILWLLGEGDIGRPHSAPVESA